MKELQVLESRTILNKEFAIYGSVENPLFRADDVAKFIGHSNASKILSNVDEEDKELHVISTLTNSYNALFLTEDGFYEVLMQSRKPIAKEFKKEVKMILKSIRVNGAFVPNATAEETKGIVKQFKGSKYLTSEIHDSKSIRNYIRNYEKMKLDECIDSIVEIVIPMKGEIKHTLIDIAIKELKSIDDGLIKDTIKNTFIKDTASAGIIILQAVKIGKFRKRIRSLEQAI
ncbi:Bro-N domain-containing protein [Clostridium estertheticum]|uniref:Bro-N domain-containing protein n=1 Tax=Clostridium estertheticum TaxID=238834 RepID=A0AA47ELP1_9CLOT|nr:BRO family protein [Clostridium estertheticum]MBU3153486.1 hypothetical protein [Clostridium estertheticum]WAG60888.1 hypothetical protein LL038_01150 [Clostridium estertheticum]